MRYLALMAAAFAGFVAGASMTMPMADDCFASPDVTVAIFNRPGLSHYGWSVVIGDTTLYGEGPLKGDCDLDGQVNIADGSLLMCWLFRGCE